MPACAEGMLEKIDWNKLGLKRDQFISADASDCAVPSIVYATIFAYDTTKFKDDAANHQPISSTSRSFPASAACGRTPSSISNGR